MRVHNSGSGPTRSSPFQNQLRDLYNSVLSETGSRERADQVVQHARAGLDGLYHQAMVQTRGDRNAAHAIQHRHADKVIELAGLIPDITGSDAQAAGPALRQALGILDSAGMTDREWLRPWLREHVQDDATLRAAGFNPREIRAVDSPWAYVDKDALLGLARDMLERYEKPDGTGLNASEISSYMDKARSAARRYGAGTQYRPEPAADPGAGQETADASSTTLQALGIPLRI